MKSFLIFNILSNIKATIEMISMNEIPEENCTICVSSLNQISDHESLTEKQTDETYVAFAYLYKCTNKHYSHTWCMADYIYNSFKNQKYFVEYQEVTYKCPNCRIEIKYIDFVKNIINVIVSSMKKNPDVYFYKIALVSAIKFYSLKEYNYFIKQADLSEDELKEIKNACRNTYLKLNQENLSVMADRAAKWVLFMNIGNNGRNSSINETSDEFFLSLESLKDNCDSLNFRLWLSNQEDRTALHFFLSFVLILEKYQTEIFLKYLCDSIKSYRFFKPHLFDKILQITRKKINSVPKLAAKNIEFLKEIENTIENAKKSKFTKFLKYVRKNSKIEYERIWRFEQYENTSDEYCKALHDQIIFILKKRHRCFVEIFFDYLRPIHLSYSSYKIIFDLIIRILIINPDKILSITEKIKKFFPKDSIFFMRYFFENFKPFFLLKNIKNGIKSLFIMNTFTYRNSFNEAFFKLKGKLYEKRYDFFSDIFNDYFGSIMIEGFEKEIGIYRMCLACNLIIVLRPVNEKLSYNLLRNLNFDISYKVKHKIKFNVPFILDECSNEKAQILFNYFGNHFSYSRYDFRFFFIRLVFNILNFQGPDFYENTFIAQKIYNLLKPHSFNFQILEKLISISFRNNIFIADIEILIENSYKDSMIDTNEMKYLKKQFFILNVLDRIAEK